MAKDADFVDIDIVVAIGNLFCHYFFIFQAIITQVSIAVIVVPFAAIRMASPISQGNDNETKLRHAIGPVHT